MVKEVTWDDVAIELNKTTEAFERCIKAFESLTKTYEELKNEYAVQDRITQVD